MNSNTKIGAVLLGLVLLTTLKHSAFSYLQITPVKLGTNWMDWTYSVLVVLVLDAAILYASYRGRIDLARIAAITVGALSLAAFWNRPGTFGLTQWVAVIAFSGIIPYLQYELAEIFAADLHKADDYEVRGQRIAELERERDQAVNRIAELERTKVADAARIAELEHSYSGIGQRFDEACAEIERLTQAEQKQAERLAEWTAAHDEASARIKSLTRERDALRTDLQAMTGARDQAAKERDNWKATARTLEPYQPLRTALLDGPVTLGRNQILVPERTVTKDGLVLPFRIANNNDPAVKKSAEDLVDSE